MLKILIIYNLKTIQLALSNKTKLILKINRLSYFYPQHSEAKRFSFSNKNKVAGVYEQ